MLPLLLACAADPTVADHVTLPPDAPVAVDPAIEAAVDDLLRQMTEDEKLAMLAGTALIPPSDGWPTPGVPRLGVAGFRMTDGPRGVQLAEGQTVFPVGVARAASWDPEVEEGVMAAMGREAREAGKDVLLAPTLNLVRDPRWGRAQESYGEEPALLGAMATAGARGASVHVLAVPKHFAVNSVEAERYTLDVRLDERTLREVYLPHFREVMRSGAVWWVMAAYNKVNGFKAAESRHLLTEILKGDWGFPGAVMSDWIWGLDDGPAALRAGLDLEMPLADGFRDLPDALEDGEVSWARIDDAVRRQLRAAVARDGLGWGDGSRWTGSAEHLQIAQQAAERGTVLLKNDGALPLDGGVVAVVGALADVVNTGDRGSSNVPAEGVVTPWAGLAERFPGAVPVLTDDPDDAALDAVAAADAAVVVVGLTWQDEGECIAPTMACDRETLRLSAAHEALIARVAAVQPRTIVVLEGGGAIVSEAWIDAVPAALMAWYPGHRGGVALARLLAGDVNPSGHLPVVFPRDEAQLPPFEAGALTMEYGLLHGWRWMEAHGEDPRFPFGHGLSYTTFAIDALTVTAPPLPEGPLAARFTVANTGEVAGAAVAQVYLRPPDGDLERPPRTLGAFASVWLEPGWTEEVEVEVDLHALATWDDGWRVARGGWTVEVGLSSADVHATAVVELD